MAIEKKYKGNAYTYIDPLDGIEYRVWRSAGICIIRRRYRGIMVRSHGFRLLRWKRTRN